ncbi:MAG: amidohydrolase [Chloroflexi bacterium]|nr:amidohydrolase [Chloroflexota bacterium]
MSAAELVFLGATIEPITPVAGPAPEALAITDGRITAVGRTADVEQLIGPATRVIRLDGETLLPGFQDAHIHPVQGELTVMQCDLSELSADRFDAAIRDYAARYPDRQWIVGAGWSVTDFPDAAPRRADLDALVADRPAFLWSRDGHSAWVNSRALDLAGISAATPDPPGGLIIRDPDGSPRGTLREGAVSMVEEFAPQPSAEEHLLALASVQRRLHALGITAWQDASVYDSGACARQLEAYRAAAQAGSLQARVVASLFWDPRRSLDQVEGFVEQAASAGIGRLRASTVKIWVDGVIEGLTAAMLDPYLDEHGQVTENRGMALVPPELLRDAVTALDRAGLQVHLHAIGDAGVRSALDAIEAARQANGPSDLRHHIAHIQLIHPADLPRFAALGATANMQPIWACHEPTMDQRTIPFLGPKRTNWQYPFASLLQHGARLAAGSDWPVTSANPLLEIEVAMTRVSEVARSGEPFLPAERLSLDQALAAFTIGSAYVSHLDAETGSIEVGKLADLALLDRNLRDPDAAPIGEASVQATWVEGLEVYAKPMRAPG